MRKILFLFAFFIFTAVASFAETARFPLACGVFEIGGIVDIQPESPGRSTMNFILADGTLSKTRLSIPWNQNPSVIQQGKFWVHGKFRINKRTSPYLVKGSLIESPKILPAMVADTLRPFVLLEEELPCD